MTRLPLSVLLLVAAACSGGGDASPGASGIGNVNLVVDTATGSDAIVQVQVVAATLDLISSGTTENLLAAPQMLTLADPGGDPQALTLRSVPTGQYTGVHLFFAPGSAVALYGDGRTVPLNLGFELAVPFTETLSHSAQGRSWIEIGHDGAPPPPAALQASWVPSLSGRPSGSSILMEGLEVAAVQSGTATVMWTNGNDAPLQVEFGAGCTFGSGDDHGEGGRESFLRDLDRGDELEVEGDLDHDGRLHARHARHGRGNGEPRLIGRITELRPATEAFVMDVIAETRRGIVRFNPLPVMVLVSTTEAVMHRSCTRIEVTFAELQVGHLVKVAVSSRAPGTGGLEEVTASAVAVAGLGVPMRPLWQGSVDSVDVPGNKIVVVPRGGEPIVVNGQAVEQVDVNVLSTTVLLRRPPESWFPIVIGIGDIVAGQDRIWWRGVATGPTSIDATVVLVKNDD